MLKTVCRDLLHLKFDFKLQLKGILKRGCMRYLYTVSVLRRVDGGRHMPRWTLSKIVWTWPAANRFSITLFPITPSTIGQLPETHKTLLHCTTLTPCTGALTNRENLN